MTILRASVTADATGAVEGDPAPVLIDGADTAITANGLAHYKPVPGDRLLVQKVGGVMEVVQFLARGTVPWVANGLLQPGEQIVAGASLTTGARTVYDDTGITAYDSTGTETFAMDASTGDVSFIGELGTAMPGDVGIFMYSLNFGRFGTLGTYTRPVIQFQVHASRDQPSIQSDTVGGSNLYLYSGANTSSRETQVFVGQGKFNVGIESTPNDGLYAGAVFDLERTQLIVETDTGIGIGGLSKGVVIVSDPQTHMGFISGAGDLRGYSYLGTGFDWARIYTHNTMDVVDVDTLSYKGINASAFNVSSDANAKSSAKPVMGALAAVRAMPVYDYTTTHGTGQGRGVMAQDAQKVVPAAVTTGGLQDQLVVDLYALLGTTMAAVQELAAQVDSLKKG